MQGPAGKCDGFQKTSIQFFFLRIANFNVFKEYMYEYNTI
jgi:hypothetical protein